MLPIVSTMIMPGRIAQGEAPLWQVGVAIAVTVVAAVVLPRVGSTSGRCCRPRASCDTGRRSGFRPAESQGTSRRENTTAQAAQMSSAITPR